MIGTDKGRTGFALRKHPARPGDAGYPIGGDPLLDNTSILDHLLTVLLIFLTLAQIDELRQRRDKDDEDDE